MMTPDPWRDLTPPSASAVINARRVSAEAPWDFFWARSVDGKCLLVLEHDAGSSPSARLPKLKGVDVSITGASSGNRHLLVLKLLDTAQKDIFYRLCTDIVASASAATSEDEAVRLALARTWRWHHLLRGGTDGRLSPEEQKGLVGELLVLERILLPQLPARDAVRAWRGPLGSPKDFEIGRLCIEAKARGSSSAPHIAISSEDQLDDTDLDALYLYVVSVDQAPSGGESGVTVVDMALRVRYAIALVDEGALSPYEDLISAAGLRGRLEMPTPPVRDGLCRANRYLVAQR